MQAVQPPKKRNEKQDKKPAPLKKPSRKVLQKILSKFILNLPQEELTEQRIFHHLTNAYYYYIDYEQPENNQPPIDSNFHFFQELYDESNFLQHYLRNIER